MKLQVKNELASEDLLTMKRKWTLKIDATSKAKHIQILQGPKVSRESDLRSVPYNRPVSVRS